MKNAEDNTNVRKEFDQYLDKSDPSKPELRIEDRSIPGGIAALKDYMQAQPVTELILRDNGLIKQEDIVDLVNSEQMRSVTYLDLTKQGVTDNTLEAIVNSPHLQNLEQLGLRDNDIQSVFAVLTKDVTKLPNIKTIVTPDEEGLEALGIHRFIKSREILQEAFRDDKKENIEISKTDAERILGAMWTEKSKGTREISGANATLVVALSKTGKNETIEISKLDAKELLMNVIKSQGAVIKKELIEQQIKKVEKDYKNELATGKSTIINKEGQTVAAKPTPNLKRSSNISR